MYRLSERVLAIAALALAGLQGALAQNSTGVCIAATGYAWAENSLGQDPCQVANDLFAADPCDQSNISYPPLTNTTGPNSYYDGPTSAAQSTECTCNTVIYSLISACGLCQNGTFLYWSEWTDNCYVNDTLYQEWPASIPSDTAIPPWAYMPLVNGFWDGPQAHDNASAVAAQSTAASSMTSSLSTSATTVSTTGTAPSTHSTTPSMTTASASATGSGTSGAGRIVGCVGGGFAGAVILAFLGVF